ncbi:MAG: DUF4345 domain-containing protein [Cyanobacteria bacterium P01_D01_bin.73]
MRNSISLKVFLGVSGLVAIAISFGILISPTDFYALNHIDINGDVNLLSEIRAPATALLTYGALIVSGTFIPRLTFTSVALSTVLYLSYGFGRLVSMVIDGLPGISLVVSAGIEVLLGVISLLYLWKCNCHWRGQVSSQGLVNITANMRSDSPKG